MLLHFFIILMYHNNYMNLNYQLRLFCYLLEEIFIIFSKGTRFIKKNNEKIAVVNSKSVSL